MAESAGDNKRAILDDATRASIERLLASRPDLATKPVSSLRDLQTRAHRRDTVHHAVEHLNRLDLEILETLLACNALDETELADMAGGVPADRLTESLQRLSDRWLVKEVDGKWRANNLGHLNVERPARLGRDLASLSENVAEHELNNALRLLGRKPQTRRALIVAELRDVMTDAEAMRSLLEEAPREVQQLLRRLANGSPSVQLPYSSAGRYRNPELHWLLERALLLPSRWGIVELPREAGITLRGGRIITESSFDPPVLEVDTTSELDNGHVAQRVSTFIAQIDDICRATATLTPRCLKSGGVGVREMKRIATTANVDERTAGLLLELAHAANLIESTHVRMPPPKTKAGKPSRSAVPEMFEELNTTGRYTQWRSQGIGEKWLLLARSWLSVTRHVSAAGRRNDEGRLINVLDADNYGQRHSCRRFALLQALSENGTNRVASDDTAISEFVAWHADRLFAQQEQLSDEVELDDVITDLRIEAEMLGLWIDQRLSPLAFHLFDGDFLGAAAFVDDITPPPVNEITVQADGTVMIAGLPEADMFTELQQFASVTSRDVAMFMRIDESTLRTALDNDVAASRIIETLDRYAPKGVPQAVRYLIDDVARRHGHLAVGEAQSFVQSDDPAVLADVVRHRSLAKLGLRLLAPTVAVSSVNQAELLDALRAAGFMPTYDHDAATKIDEAPHRLSTGNGRPAFENISTVHIIDAAPDELVDRLFEGAQPEPEIDDDDDDDLPDLSDEEFKEQLEELISRTLTDAGGRSGEHHAFGPLATDRESVTNLIVRCWIERICLAVFVLEDESDEADDVSMFLLFISQYDGHGVKGNALFHGEVAIDTDDIAWVMPVHPAGETHDWYGSENF